MKRVLGTIITLLLSLSLYSQITTQPITWKSEIKNLDKNIYEISVIGTFNNNEWHIYDLGPYSEGPNPTTLVISKNKNIKLVGSPYLKTQSKIKYDEMFSMEIGICEEKVIVAQKIEILKNGTSIKDKSILATVEWQACNNGSCLPPTEKDFNIELPVIKVTEESVVSNVDSSVVSSDSTKSETIIAPAIDNTDAENSVSIWSVIIEAIIWGFVALLTPCVFPMVPMTVSFFLKNSSSNESGKSKGKLMASLYGLSIVALYTLPIALIIGITYFAGGESVTADIFNWLATHWVPNVIFFLIFMVFAASFFGAFEITMPSWMVNKSDSNSEKGGFIGVFFMALTLVLVSFSCTGPIVGTVLIKSTQGEIWQPIVTMMAFSIAFALPFTLFAFAPSLLKDLPKSGGWLNSVKVVLGFIEVALGFKFLSVADQTYHWGLLDREVYLAIWIVTFSLLGLYLLGKLRFAHDDKFEHLTVKRLAFAIITFSFVVYMIPGMWGAPLKALSGYLPPITTMDFIQGNENTSKSDEGTTAMLDGIKPKYSDFLHLPHGLVGFFEYNEAIEYAKKVNKPLFIDFTGHGCVNCREMEARVWSDPEVLTLLKENYVILALYADDKKEANESDWIVTESGKTLKTIGKINSHLAMNKFNVNAQPYYAIIDPSTEKHLVEPSGYNLDVTSFINFLKGGLN